MTRRHMRMHLPCGRAAARGQTFGHVPCPFHRAPSSLVAVHAPRREAARRAAERGPNAKRVIFANLRVERGTAVDMGCVSRVSTSYARLVAPCSSWASRHALSDSQTSHINSAHPAHVIQSSDRQPCVPRAVRYRHHRHQQHCHPHRFRRYRSHRFLPIPRSRL